MAGISQVLWKAFSSMNFRIGSDNGLPLTKQQAIRRTNDGKFTDAHMHH